MNSAFFWGLFSAVGSFTCGALGIYSTVYVGLSRHTPPSATAWLIGAFVLDKNGGSLHRGIKIYKAFYDTDDGTMETFFLKSYNTCFFYILLFNKAGHNFINAVFRF